MGTKTKIFVGLIILTLLGLLLVACVALYSVRDALLPVAVTVTPSLPLSTNPPSATPTPSTQIGLPMVASDLEAQIIQVYDTAGKSVVNITSKAYVYNRFLGQLPQEGTGSGFIYDNRGHIVTNYHVIEGADELIVTLAGGDEFQARVVGTDPSNDLAVLEIDAAGSLPPALPLADSDALRVGQFVVAIGTPFGLDQTLTTGVVSALGRVIESPEANQFIGEVIQTDAAINPGNSGGPLLDLNGAVIGVNSQILSTSGSSAGVGFAISANTVRRVVPELIANGSYPHPWLDIETIDLDAYTLAVLREVGMESPVESGVMVVGFEDNSSARAAGLSSGRQRVRIGPYIFPVDGDIITAIDGVPVAKMEDLTIYLELNTQIGDTVELTFYRDGTQRTLPVEVTARPVNR